MANIVMILVIPKIFISASMDDDEKIYTTVMHSSKPMTVLIATGLFNHKKVIFPVNVPI